MGFAATHSPEDSYPRPKLRWTMLPRLPGTRHPEASWDETLRPWYATFWRSLERNFLGQGCPGRDLSRLPVCAFMGDPGRIFLGQGFPGRSFRPGLVLMSTLSYQTYPSIKCIR